MFARIRLNEVNIIEVELIILTVFSSELWVAQPRRGIEEPKDLGGVEVGTRREESAPESSSLASAKVACSAIRLRERDIRRAVLSRKI